MSKRSKGRREGPKDTRRQGEEEEDEVTDLLNFPSLSSLSPTEEKYDKWLMLACAATVASVYIATLFPSVPGGKERREEA